MEHGLAQAAVDEGSELATQATVIGQHLGVKHNAYSLFRIRPKHRVDRAIPGKFSIACVAPKRSSVHDDTTAEAKALSFAIQPEL